MDNYRILFVVLGVLLAGGVACYIYFLRSTVRVLGHVLDCIKGDSYATGMKKSFRFLNPVLHESVTNVLSILKERSETLHERLNYVENLLNNVDSALVVTDEEGYVNYLNTVARTELLGDDFGHLSQLQVLSPDIPEALMHLREGEMKTLQFEREAKVYEMVAVVVRYHSAHRSLRLINLRDMHQVFVENEVQTTHKLMRVLTHEIMNSLSPIIALSDTMQEQMKKQCYDLADVCMGIGIIKKRSEGLLHFVENYRKLSRLAPPSLLPVSLSGLLTVVRPLTLGYKTPVDFSSVDGLGDKVFLHLDIAQIEQVLLNLLKNADEACDGIADARVVVEVEVGKSQVLLHVTDNGMGISPEAIKRIFVPFYTTKKQGSGIGLALCRQIMEGHRGNITVKSSVGEGTRFTLHFPVFRQLEQR